MHQLPGAKAAILFYLTQFVGEQVETIELDLVSGISEYARRIRELRVEHGYDIRSGFTDSGSPYYTLVSASPNKEIARQWRLANEIRQMKGSASSRMLHLFLENIGRPLTIDMLDYVSRIKETRRRTSELRSEQGYRVLTRLTGRPDLRNQEYVLESPDALPKHDRKIPDEIYEAVLERDKNRCRKCNWHPSDFIRGGSSKRAYIEVHHRDLHSDGGASTVANLFTLCNMHHDHVHAEKLKGEDFDHWLNLQ